MKKNITTLVLSLFLIFLTLKANIQSDDPIILTLKIPPPGKLNMENFWGVTLTNNSGREQSVYLIGTAIEKKDGQIAKGTTVPFLLKKGSNNIRIKELTKPPDIEYTASDPRYKESLARTGDFPEGQYEICVKVFSAGANEELGNDCIVQEVGQSGLLTLIDPVDGQVIDSKTPLIFSWSATGKMPEGGFTLKICEVSKGQTPEAAMKSNRLFFEKVGIKSPSFQYLNSAKAFEDGKKYAWMVTAIDRGKEVVSSEVGSFSRQACGVLMITNKVTCTGNGSNIYNYLLTFKNLSDPVTDPTCIVSVTSITITGILFTMSGLPTINPGQTISVSGTIGPTSLASGNFTINATSPGFSGTWNVPFTLETVPQMATITGPSSVCQGQSGYVYSIPAMSAFVSSNWTVTGGTITAGQGSTSITVTFGGSSGNVCVTANNSCGTSTPNCKAIIITAPTVPPVPTAIAATGIQQTGFTANWNFATGAIFYYLDVATDAVFTNYVSSYHNISAGSTVTTAFTVTGLTCNTNYYYRVRSVGICSGISANSNIITVITSHTLSPTPTASPATAILGTQFTANWSAVPGASGYFIDVYTISGGVTTYVTGYQNKSAGNVIACVVTGLNFNTTYHYRIRAVVGCGVSANSYGVTVNTTPDCNCGQWSNNILTYTEAGIGSSVTMADHIWDSKSITLTYGVQYDFASPVYNCSPISSLCSPIYTWFWDGNPTQYTTTGQTISYIVPPGYYILRIKITCGGNLCGERLLAVNSLPEFYIGQHYGGGIVFYLDNTGKHGLIVSQSDQGNSQWKNVLTTLITNAKGTSIGTGQANTTAIVSVQGPGSYAASLCDQLVLNGYSDWFLPSKDELSLLYARQFGGWISVGLGWDHWSSSEYNDWQAWKQSASWVGITKHPKVLVSGVRAIRKF